MFSTFDDATKTGVRSHKAKVVVLVKWLVKMGVEKIQEEQQKNLQERDAALALINNDLQAIKYENVGLQGEIHANDQYIDRFENTINRFKIRCGEHAKNLDLQLSDDLGKHAPKDNDKHFDYT